MGDTLSTLPSRPLRRVEVDAIEKQESIHAIFPIYGERTQNHDTAYVLIFALEDKLKATAYTGKRWAVVGNRRIETSPGEGISFDDFEYVDELQQEALNFLNQQDEGITIEE